MARGAASSVIGQWPKAVLLDFFGTVVEEDHALIRDVAAKAAAATPLATAQEFAASWRQAFLELCACEGAEFRSQKDVDRLSLERALQRYGLDLDAGAMCEPFFSYWSRPTILPESRAVIDRCGVPICLVSNIDNAELRAALDYLDLRFDYVVTSEDCRAYKPCTPMFAQALALLGLEPADVLHVGDSFASDVRGAQAAGIPVMWINRRGRAAPERHNPPDYVARDLTGLLELVPTR